MRIAIICFNFIWYLKFENFDHFEKNYQIQRLAEKLHNTLQSLIKSEGAQLLHT